MCLTFKYFETVHMFKHINPSSWYGYTGNEPTTAECTVKKTWLPRSTFTLVSLSLPCVIRRKIMCNAKVNDQQENVFYYTCIISNERWSLCPSGKCSFELCGWSSKQGVIETTSKNMIQMRECPRIIWIFAHRT